MKISVTDIAVILDTLAGSIAISDRGELFHYTVETRKMVLRNLTDEAETIKFQLVTDEEIKVEK